MLRDEIEHDDTFDTTTSGHSRTASLVSVVIESTEIDDFAVEPAVTFGAIEGVQMGED